MVNTMVKVTLNENLVPCAREKWVNGNPYSDLVHNVLHARKLIRLASQIFQLQRGKATFSGYINEHKAGSYDIKLWHGEVSLHSLSLHDLGYSGVLHVDLNDLQATGNQVVTQIFQLPAVPAP